MAPNPRIQPVNDIKTRYPVQEMATLVAEDVGVDGLFTSVALTKVVDTPVPSGLGATTRQLQLLGIDQSPLN